MKTTQQRINNAVGQMNGIVRMIESGDDCFKVVVQFKADSSALKRAMAAYIQDQAESCFRKNASAKDREKVLRIIREL
jgi:DNA-binding FrmR family transcriptional regulator